MRFAGSSTRPAFRGHGHGGCRPSRGWLAQLVHTRPSPRSCLPKRFGRTNECRTREPPRCWASAANRSPTTDRRRAPAQRREQRLAWLTSSGDRRWLAVRNEISASSTRSSRPPGHEAEFPFSTPARVRTCSSPIFCAAARKRQSLQSVALDAEPNVAHRVDVTARPAARSRLTPTAPASRRVRRAGPQVPLPLYYWFSPPSAASGRPSFIDVSPAFQRRPQDAEREIPHEPLAAGGLVVDDYEFSSTELHRRHLQRLLWSLYGRHAAQGENRSSRRKPHRRGNIRVQWPARAKRDRAQRPPDPRRSGVPSGRRASAGRGR